MQAQLLNNHIILCGAVAIKYRMWVMANYRRESTSYLELIWQILMCIKIIG